MEPRHHRLIRDRERIHHFRGIRNSRWTRETLANPPFRPTVKELVQALGTGGDGGRERRNTKTEKNEVNRDRETWRQNRDKRKRETQRQKHRGCLQTCHHLLQTAHLPPHLVLAKSSSSRQSSLTPTPS